MTRTLRNAVRWLMGDVEEPDVPASDTRLWLHEQEIASRKRREDWLENTMVYAGDQEDRPREKTQ